MPDGEYPPHETAMDQNVYIEWAGDTDDAHIIENNGGGDMGRVMLGYVSLDRILVLMKFINVMM